VRIARPEEDEDDPALLVAELAADPRLAVELETAPLIDERRDEAKLEADPVTPEIDAEAESVYIS
jgi:hypothetical protein